MSIQITSKNYATRNYSGGNSFYLANSGQLVTETFEFVVNFDFVSTAQNQIFFLSTTQIQVIGTNWGALGFVTGDSITLTGTIDNGSSTVTYSAVAYTITDIDNDILTVNSTLDPASSGQVVGQFMPFTNGANSNSQLTIVNSTRTAPEVVEILHNQIPNSANGGQASLIDGEVNRFRALNVDSMSVSDVQTLVQLGNKSGGTYTTATLTRLADAGGKKKYKYILTYKPIQYVDATFDQPSIYSNVNSLKPWVNIKCLPEENNPNSAFTVTYSSQLGNVGYLNESYNQGVNEFTIDSVTLTDENGDAVDNIDYNQNTEFSAVISGSANFLAKAEAEFYIIPPTEDFKNNANSNGANSHLCNVFADTVVTAVQLGEVLIEDFGFTTDTNEITITGRIEPSADFAAYIESLSEDDRRYRLTVTVSSTGGDANENNAVTLVLKEGILEKAPVNGGVYEDVTFSGFYNHSQPLDGVATPNYSGCAEDDFVYRTQFYLDSTNVYKSLNVQMQVVRDSDGQFFTLFERLINFSNYVTTPDGIQQINYTEQLQQFLDSDDRNIISLQLSGLDVGTQYGLDLIWSVMASWRYWIAQNDALVDFFDATLPNNGLNNEWMRYLREAGYSIRTRCQITTDEDVAYYWDASVNLQDYDDSTDITTEIEIYDASDVLQTSLLANQTMRIKAIHTKDDAWDIDDSWAWVSIRPFESETNKRISTEWDWTSQNYPLKPLSGETRLTISFPSTNVMVTECLVDTSMLDIDNYTLVARAESPKYPICQSPINYIFDVIDQYEDKLKINALRSFLNGMDTTNLSICCPVCEVDNKDTTDTEKVYCFGQKTLVDAVVSAFDGTCCRDEYGVTDECEVGFDTIWDEIDAGIIGVDLTSLVPSQLGGFTDNQIQTLKDRLFATTTSQVHRWELMNEIMTRGLIVRCNVTTGVNSIGNISDLL